MLDSMGKFDLNLETPNQLSGVRNLESRVRSFEFRVPGSECYSLNLIPGTQNRFPKTLRGQLVSFDFMASAMLYFTVFLLAYTLSMNFLADYYSNYSADLQHAATLYASEKLFSRGALSWTNSSIDSISDIGLESSEAVLDPVKVGTFTNYSNANITKIKSVLGIGAYLMRFEVRNSTNHVLYSAGDYLNMTNLSLRNVDSVTRVAMLNGDVASVNLIVWK